MFCFKKNSLKLLSVFAIAFFGILLTGCNEKENTKKVSNEIVKESSIVSEGVELDDLGNIINGQYFFDDGTNQYYSSFDQNNVAHIYRTNKSDGKTEIIFNGFGWSFVIHEGWLYFSGNAGASIDGTYNLFRMKSDGSNLELLNETFCYSMHFYDNWLYYLKKSNWDSDTSDIYRSSLDGKNEELLVSNVKGYSIIYKNKLYYLDSDSYIYGVSPDGKDKKQIISDKVQTFIIGQDKILYVDSNYNVKSSKVNGSDQKTIKVSDGQEISNINSYKDTIFYVKYNRNLFNNEKYAYPYDLYSIKIDGTNDIKIYESESYGFYINAIENKVYVLDYARDINSKKLVAVIKNMSFDGTKLIELFR